MCVVGRCLLHHKLIFLINEENFINTDFMSSYAILFCFFWILLTVLVSFGVEWFSMLMRRHVLFVLHYCYVLIKLIKVDAISCYECNQFPKESQSPCPASKTTNHGFFYDVSNISTNYLVHIFFILMI